MLYFSCQGSFLFLVTKLITKLLYGRLRYTSNKALQFVVVKTKSVLLRWSLSLSKELMIRKSQASHFIPSQR